MGASKSKSITQSTGVLQGASLISSFTTPIGSLICSLGILYRQYADDTQLYTSLHMGNGHSTLQLTTCAEAFVNNIKLLGVTVDNHLSFDQHISDVVRSCNYHIHSLRHIRPLIDRETAINLACSIVASRLDYCNSVMYGVSETNIAKLQRMQNNLARVVCKTPYNTSVTKLLCDLHLYGTE